MEQSENTLLMNEEVNQNKFNGQEEENNGERREWSQLTDDIFVLITRHLNLKDNLMLRAVCLEWRDIINYAIANKQFHPLPTPPFMMPKHYLETPSLNLNTRSGINPKGPSSLIQDVRGKLCHCSVEGWLLMSDDDSNKKSNLSFFFLNPMIGCRISVPAKLNFPSKSPLGRKKLNISKVVASSNPCHNSSNCFLVVLFNDHTHIAFCKLSDESWSIIKKDHQYNLLRDVEILDSKLYVITRWYLLVYDLQDSSNGIPPTSKVVTLLPIIHNPQHCKVGYIIYIAKDEALGELNLIYMKVISNFNTPPETVKLHVFKLCFSNETSKFMQVDNLGDRVLFLDGINNMVMPTAKFNHTQGLIAANSIYFLVWFRFRKDPWKGLQSGVFSLTDKKIEYFDINRASDELEPSRPMWFSPSLV